MASPSERKVQKEPIVESKRHFEGDEAIMARFGKTQRLRRRFGLIPAIGLTSTIMITWEANTGTLLNGLQNGGPAGLVYGFLFAWLGAILQCLVVAEIASMIPLSGGPFNWVAILSPPWCRRYLSYLTGWLSMISYLALVAGTCYVAGTMVQGLLILNYPDYVFERWHGTLLFHAVLFFSLFVNTFLGALLPQIESLLLIFHILGFFAILVPIVSLTPQYQPASFVFTHFLNNGEWDTTMLATLVGLISCTTSFPGLDAADHLAEEIRNASRNLPIAIGVATILNGTLGFSMLLALLFCMSHDIQSTLTSTTYYPFIEIYSYATGSTSGGTALTAVMICTQIFAAIGVVATASRMIWAFARENGLPFSKYLSRVNERTRLPIYAIITTAVINLLLALINIGSSVGFTAFISLIVAGYDSSLILAASAMLHKRLTTPDADIPWGPFHMGKRTGVTVTVFAIAHSTVVVFFSMWPSFVNPTPEEMNWCVLVYGAGLLFSVGFWFVNGRKIYTGPLIEI